MVGEPNAMSRYARLRLSETFKFKCVRCDMCCGTGPNVSLTGYDVVRMAKFLQMSWKSFLRAYVNVIVADIFVFMSIRGEHGKCPFLHYKPSGETLCVVYPARPLRCRLYPLVVESVKPSHVYLDSFCPGVGKGGEKRPPERLVKHYVWELKTYYSRLTKLVLEEGLEPLQALENLLEALWSESEEKPDWANLDYIESLGAT